MIKETKDTTVQGVVVTSSLTRRMWPSTLSEHSAMQILHASSISRPFLPLSLQTPFHKVYLLTGKMTGGKR